MHPALLDYLGLPRFTNVEKSSDPAGEDAFCAQLKKVGADFWESQDEYHEMNVDEVWPLKRIEKVFPPRKPLGCWTESGGVWVYKDTEYRNPQGGAQGIKNAFNMVELCQAIELAGGRFYWDPRDSEDTRDMI